MKRRSPVRASQPRKGKGRLFSLTVFLSVLSILALGIGVLTFVQANQLMRQSGRPMKPYTANAMPQYMPVSFLSGDEQSRLSGWFFPGGSAAPGVTVILIHNHHGNRAPFEDATGRLIFRLNESGYNVLTFDQRHAGDSDGALTTYGYSEWQDVIGAIAAAQRITGSADCVLYGIGSGVTAALKAWHQLPETTGRNGTAARTAVSATSSASSSWSGPDDGGDSGGETKPLLTFGRSAVKAMILDTPLPNSDDYIRQDVDQSGVFAHLLTRYTVPLAVRLTADLSNPLDIEAEAGLLPIPLLLMKSSHPAFRAHAQDRVITARLNALPDRTHIFESPAESDPAAAEDSENDAVENDSAASPGRGEPAGKPWVETGSYRPDPEGYIQSLLDFLKAFAA